MVMSSSKVLHSDIFDNGLCSDLKPAPGSPESVKNLEQKIKSAFNLSPLKNSIKNNPLEEVSEKEL
jgi:hypothetical protein